MLSSTPVRHLGKVASGLPSSDHHGGGGLNCQGAGSDGATGVFPRYGACRMYRDSEMIALAASGFGHARIFKSVLLTGIPLAFVVGLLVMELLPWSRAMSMN